MKITPAIIVSQALQACYGLSIFLITDEMAQLATASSIILVTTFAFTWLLNELKSYPGTSVFFWLTFGFTINAAWLVIATYVQWSSFLLYLGLPMNILQLILLAITVCIVFLFSLTK